MKKDLRDREALRQSPELSTFADAPAFDAVKVTDLRKLAELIRHSGSLASITIESAATFGGTSEHRFLCAKRALSALAGEDHPATRAISAALTLLGHSRRQGTRHRDCRTREAILHASHWESFRALPGAGTIGLQELRAVDRYLAFSANSGLPSGEVESFLAFVKNKDSSMLLRTLRDGLEMLLTSSHPAIMAAERARSLKETERQERIRPEHSATIVSPRVLEASVAYETLRPDWRDTFETLKAGKRVRRRKYAPKSVDNMIVAARQLVWAARAAGLQDEISVATVRAYDSALEKRNVGPTSRNIFFTSLRQLGLVLGLDEALLSDLHDLSSYYGRQARGTIKKKEERLANLPDLSMIFDKANALLDAAATIKDRRRLLTLYVDAAALAFLSLIPLRNEDTKLFWGRQIVYIGDDDPADWDLAEHDEPLAYYLDLRTSKTDAGLSGPLAPILNPFLDALILRGRDPRLLPQFRREIMKSKSAVFPNLNGTARGARSLSERRRKNLGTGSSISRTRIHTLLGAMGEHGVRAALALCAQRSPRTAIWYQAEALGRRRMLESQDMMVNVIELSEEEAKMLERL